MGVQLPFVVSSPGKVIAFGEHAVVYGKPAIAASLSQRTYLLVRPNDEDPGALRLQFPDIQFDYSWQISSLPWAEVADHRIHPKDIQYSSSLSAEFVEALLSKPLAGISKNFQHAAAYAFLALYVNFTDENTPGYTFTVKSSLPIGAGLGSSATFAVSLAAAMGLLGGHIDLPSNLSTESPHRDYALDFIDKWSFLGEKCLHGTPSGIDNAVATRGGAVLFQRQVGNGGESAEPSVRVAIQKFPPLNFLLTNTKRARRTAHLVGSVAELKAALPKPTTAVLDAIEETTRAAYDIMLRHPMNLDEEAHSQLSDLIRVNHGLLVALGVSHPVLERVKSIADSLGIGETKLTGAGGGGCAITLLAHNHEQREDMYEEKRIFEQNLAEMKRALEKEGFEAFTTVLGGKGVGVYVGEGEKGGSLVQKFLGVTDAALVEEQVGTKALNWEFWS